MGSGRKNPLALPPAAVRPRARSATGADASRQAQSDGQVSGRRALQAQEGVATTIVRVTRYRAIAFLPAAMLMAAIFILSSQPSPRVSSVDWVTFLVLKTGHVLGYAALAASFAFALGVTRFARIAIGLAFILAVAFAATDEFHQSFTARDSSVGDIAIDAFGAAIGLLVYRSLRTRLRVLRA